MMENTHCCSMPPRLVSASFVIFESQRDPESSDGTMKKRFCVLNAGEPLSPVSDGKREDKLLLDCGEEDSHRKAGQPPKR